MTRNRAKKLNKYLTRKYRGKWERYKGVYVKYCVRKYKLEDKRFPETRRYRRKLHKTGLRIIDFFVYTYGAFVTYAEAKGNGQFFVNVYM